ncbi:MAG TPA: ferredoxin reductase family protein [Solirubrobacteraceae bacterium]|nr:ferredoxin reductase family protein [Solirubrobacteraceae bacterium]
MTNAEVAVEAPRIGARDVGLARGAARRRAALAAAVWIVILANGAIIVWLWLHDGGVTAAHGPGALATSLGRITGLLGAYLALIQVLLLARLPGLEQLIGFDRMTVWHRRNGKACLTLLLAHMVLITAGYARSDQVSLGAEISSLAHDYPGMIAATVGTGLLVLVVVTSLVLVRRRLPYEAWHAVHLLAYAGIALAWSHQIPTGNELSADHAAADYWTALYVVTLVLLVAFRIVGPVARGLWFGMRVDEVVPEGPGVVSVRISGRHLERLRAQPGQFFLWRFFARGLWWQAHPFSLSAAPDGRSLRITVKEVGGFTARLRTVRPGTAVHAEGPFGVFTPDVQRRDRVLLIAGGIGITPVRALLEAIPGDVVVLYRALREQDLVLRDELQAIADRRRARIAYVVGDHAAPGAEHLLSARHLQELVPDLARREVYLCGPPAMTRTAERSLRHAGVPRRYTHIERFAL